MLVTFSHAVTDALKRTFDYRGRSGRRAYLWYLVSAFLWVPLPMLFAFLAEHVLGSMPLRLMELLLYAVALFTILWLLPYAALTVRRLHDAGWSRIWALLHLLPLLGLIVPLMCLRRTHVVAS